MSTDFELNYYRLARGLFMANTLLLLLLGDDRVGGDILKLIDQIWDVEDLGRTDHVARDADVSLVLDVDVGDGATEFGNFLKVELLSDVN